MMQPGRFLNDFLDFIPQFKQRFSKRDSEIVMGMAVVVRRLGTMFVLPDHGRLKDRTKPIELPGNIFRPPYPICVLEFAGDHTPDVPVANRSSRRIVMVFDHGDRVDIVPVTYVDHMKIWAPPIFKFTLHYGENAAVHITGNGMNTLTHFGALMPDLFGTLKNDTFGGSVEQFARTMADDYLDELWAYTDFCRTLHENHVEFEDIPIHKGQAKMRRALGKSPLFTYKTLVIGKKKRKSAHQGGTHASPRSHLRRGYYRTSQKGVRHWVQPCMVKGDTDGFVHKDYLVEVTYDG
jgi:hypothetical protein